MPARPRQQDLAVTIVGLGNIGSHLIALIGRVPRIGRMTLVDPGRYEVGNLATQEILPSDVGGRKVDVQAARLRRIRPGLEVVPLAARVEDVPLGLLRGDVLLACLDSRRARQHASEAAWRLGVPWVDAGVDGAAMLARVTLYAPGPESPCLECGWGKADYAALEPLYACGAPAPAPTAAPALLGALAAALQADECRRVLVGGPRTSREVVYDVERHQVFASARRRAARCRFDHAGWTIRPLPTEVLTAPLDKAVRRLSRSGRIGRPLSLGVACRVLARQGSCAACGRPREARWRLAGRSARPDARCARCGAPCAAVVAERVELGSIGGPGISILGSLGLRTGDVLDVRGTRGEARWEVRGMETP